MAASRGNTVMVGLMAALIVPRVKRLTGIDLTLDDVGDLIALGLIAWHGIATGLEHAWMIFQRYYPPPQNPTSPGQPAQPKVNP